MTDAQALAALPLQGQRLLLAIGGRHLPVMAAAALCRCHPLWPSPSVSDDYVQHCGRVCTRITLRWCAPCRGMYGGDRAGPCRRWGISAVLCRQSGGVTEQLWHRLTRELELSLLLLRRPAPPDRMVCVEDVSTLLEWLERD